jgi:hypothetical protein
LLTTGFAAAGRRSFARSKAGGGVYVKQTAKRKIYTTGTEWAQEIKSDPHYVDLLMAVREGVKSVYPDSLFAEGGSYNMDIGGGVREIDEFSTHAPKENASGGAHCHIYTMNILAIEPNFKALLDVARKHGLGGAKMFFAEGMHYAPYDVPRGECRLRTGAVLDGILERFL